MITSPALPPNFFISERARHKIAEWIENLNESKQKSYIPAIFMGTVTAGSHVGNDVPMVGAYPLEDIDQSDIFECNGLSFVFPVLEREYDIFDGRTLDVAENKYVLL